MIARDELHEIAHGIELFVGSESAFGDHQADVLGGEEEEEVSGFFAFDESGPVELVIADGVGEGDSLGGNIDGLMTVEIDAVFPVAGEGSAVIVGGDGADVEEQ